MYISSKSLYLPDDALIVQNIYIESFLFVFYCETYNKYNPRKVYLQCFTFHHPRQSNIYQGVFLCFIHINIDFIYHLHIF